MMDKDDGFGYEMYYIPYGVDQGSGIRMVQYKAWRIDRPNVVGYGMTLDNAIDDLVENVQPLVLTDLKYCIRLKHSPDMPLKHPRKNCAFRRGDECVWHPATIRYCMDNRIEWDHSTKFRCVLAEE